MSNARRPKYWLKLVNQAETDEDLKQLRTCVHRGYPFGSKVWIQRIAIRLGLEYTVRYRGRPEKQVKVQMEAGCHGHGLAWAYGGKLFFHFALSDVTLLIL